MGILSMPVGPHAIFTNTNAMQEGFQYEAWIKKRATTGRARSSGGLTFGKHPISYSFPGRRWQMSWQMFETLRFSLADVDSFKKT